MTASLQLLNSVCPTLFHGYQVARTYLSVKATGQEGCTLTSTSAEAQQKYLSAASIAFGLS